MVSRDQTPDVGGARYRIGVDIGGTFTDLVAIDEDTGQVSTMKVPTTPDDQSVGFLDAIDRCGVNTKDISLLIHGCTVGLNAVLTRRGSRIGLITTEGFRDTTAMGRGQRPSAHQFDPRWRRAYGDAREPFVPRFLRRTVRERVSSRGEILVPLDREGVRTEVEFLMRQGVEAIVICFINSYANSSHEREAKSLVNALSLGLYCWTSTEVHPCFKEHPRFSTALLNTYVGPLLDQYLDRTSELLRERGYDRVLMMMQSNGGVLPATITRQRPVYTIQSGPVGGVVAASHWGKQLGLDQLLLLDIGGTSADYCIIENGRPLVTTELELEHDVIVALPAINVHSIGAGGGSVVWIDHIGALRVGPESTGAMPGPASYGHGGVRPAVTDALVVCGLLRPEYFLGGALPLYPERARAALEPIARHLALSVEQAAGAVLDVATASLVEGAREISVYNGVDPREFDLYAYGAAGPIFASRVGRELGVRSVVLPPHPGEMCAYGLAMADLQVDLGEPLIRPLGDIDAADLTEVYADLERRARTILSEQRSGAQSVTIRRWLDGRYEGQTWETPSVPVAAGKLEIETMRELRATFDATHQRLWGYSLPHIGVKATMARITATLPFTRADPPRRAHRDRNGELDVARTAAVFLDGWTEASIVVRDALLPGDVLEGPAIVIQATSTTILHHGDSARLDEHGHLRITWN